MVPLRYRLHPFATTKPSPQQAAYSRLPITIHHTGASQSPNKSAFDLRRVLLVRDFTSGPLKSKPSELSIQQSRVNEFNRVSIRAHHDVTPRVSLAILQWYRSAKKSYHNMRTQCYQTCLQQLSAVVNAPQPTCRVQQMIAINPAVTGNISGSLQ